MMLRTRDDAGAVAIIVAIAATALFGCAALAVDLGNGEARYRSTQAQADLAAIAGGGRSGSNLPATLPGGTCSTGNLLGQTKTTSTADPAVTDVVNYLNSNLPQSDNGTSLVTASQLVDCDTSNGEVIHGTVSATNQVTANVNQVTVITPPALVRFGLAGVLGFNDVQVRGNATAEIKSPIVTALPFYASSGCDYGPQTLANPTNGHAAGSPLLSHGSETGPAVLGTLQTDPSSNPLMIPLTSDPNNTTSLIINGTGGTFTGATQVGFFESGTTTAGPEPVVVNASGFTIANAGNKITVSAPLPTALTNVQDTWYVRVKIGTGDWSKVLVGSTLNALPISVGPPILTCAQGSSSGNFGTLRLSNHNQSGNGWQPVAQNVATGLDSTLGKYPSDGTATTTCDPNASPSIKWTDPGTNCVDTETGLDSDAATSGFIKGNGLVLPSGQNGGLLTTHLSDSKSFCAGNTSNTTTMLGKQINNDTLSCWFTDPSTTISQVDNSSYSLSGPAFDQNIWYSPRLVAVPVLGQVPANGGSNSYRIVDFRYGYITEQPQSATKSTPAASGNGITLTNNGNSVQSIQIIFLNDKSLTSPPPDLIKGYANYTGTGVKDLLLVN